MTIETQIQDLLTKTETDENISILYACESGSRAWEFASPNSDFDIRFLYLSSNDIYLSVFEHKDSIEIPIKDDLDPGGWDVKKALGLLAKSNGALIEWLHSPIVYLDQNDFRKRWQKLAVETLNPNHLINHYKGLARQIQKRKLESDQPSAKGYLYACRALLAADWVATHRTPPPVPFPELMLSAPSPLKQVLEETVQWKATADEIASKGRITELDQFIAEQLDPNVAPVNHPAPSPALVYELIDAEFRRLTKL